MQRYDPIKTETEVIEFWQKNNIVEKARKKTKGKKPFYFLDGPPYTSGKIHLGTAWNKVLKDFVTRYKRMTGYDVWDRAGYDMHGLPTEGKVQKKLGMKTKEEIIKYGLAKFVKECKNFAVTNLKQMNKDFQRLGVWLDFDNAYQTIDSEYIEGTWWLVKKAHEKNRLYEDQMTMTWCGSCQTALAKHELEYKNVVDKSIYVKFPVKSKKDEYLLIWTTTPWTIPYNLGIMVHPDILYVKAKVGKEIWILAKELSGKVIKEKAGKEYRIIDEFKGKEIEGIEYIHPMEDVLKHHFDALRKKSKKLHTVVMSNEYVTTEQGTGLVHMAPGCGPEDYEVGHREGIPPFNQLDEQGYYDNTMGPFSKLHAKENNEVFIEDLDKRGVIITVEDYAHDYAHCWRCKNPVLYRTTTQWFFKVENLIPKMRKLNKEKMYWVPDWAGSAQFDSWLENLRDNGITRQRFWGSPLPVWRCDSCKEYVVVESRKDLKKYDANKIPTDLHKPWIDEVTIPCKKCKGVMKRIPDIMDVWIDAGCDSWASLGYPHDDKLFKKLYPADFIVEAKDQIRGWFNLLFVASMLALEDISFKTCYMHGFIQDSYGRKMSKSLGNIISPDEVTNKYGADTFRYYALGASNPGIDLNYNFEDIELKRRNLSILWNLHNYVLDLSKTIEINPEKIPNSIMNKAGDEEHYIISKLNSTIEEVNSLMEKYYLNQVPWKIEELYLELSRTYIQMVREKVNTGTEEEKKVVLYVVYNVLKQIILMMTIVTPYLAETIYQNLKSEFRLKQESVHLCNYPEADKKKISKELENDILLIKEIIQAVLSAREQAQIGIRWPVQEVIVETTDKEVTDAVKRMKNLIINQVNVKEVRIAKKFDEVDIKVKPNFKNLGTDFGKLAPDIISFISETDNTVLLNRLQKGSLNVKVGKQTIRLDEKHIILEKHTHPKFTCSSFSKGEVYFNKERSYELQAEGFSREVVRRIQSFRKQAKLEKANQIELYLEVDRELKGYLSNYLSFIKERVGAKTLTISDASAQNRYNLSDHGNVKGLKFKAMFNVLE
ncbi:isoleucine--tRNA ligase [Candidatus Woesearchaeota archaeon]|nr:isoleucine--tRNA ligase [Candidatus Woesearchaeota archaeon]